MNFCQIKVNNWNFCSNVFYPWAIQILRIINIRRKKAGKKFYPKLFLIMLVTKPHDSRGINPKFCQELRFLEFIDPNSITMIIHQYSRCLAIGPYNPHGQIPTHDYWKASSIRALQNALPNKESENKSIQCMVNFFIALSNK